MARAQIGQRWVLTLPKEVRDGLKPGTLVDVTARDDGVLEIRPLDLIPREDAWAYTPEHRVKIKRAIEDARAGRVDRNLGPEDLERIFDAADRGEDWRPLIADKFGG